MSAQPLVVVAGKGGVGRSTIAAALALQAARRGLRTIVAETAGRADVARALGGRPSDPMTEVELQGGLHHVTIDRRHALEEYLRNEVPGLLPARLLARSSAFQTFVEATPGMSDLLTIGKVWELAQRPRHTARAHPYDLVILDGPASGQLVGLLGAGRTFSAIARVGPVAHQAAAIDQAVTGSGTTRVIVVATPEQMAVSEALELRSALTERLGIEPHSLIVNRLFPSRFSARDAVTLASATDDPAVRSARWFHARAVAQRAQLARLQDGLLGTPCTTLPFLFKPELEYSDIEHLAELLSNSPV